ncbi:hypothetical protein AAG747_23545 [Rapidithrix thailandica]|uniref:Uncharacterized protein n=1 Tax=Rapidithrix thailandica TaxID=413964 RepID=A0AAW9S6U6_9BACT
MRIDEFDALNLKEKAKLVFSRFQYLESVQKEEYLKILYAGKKGKLMVEVILHRLTNDVEKITRITHNGQLMPFVDKVDIESLECK